MRKLFLTAMLSLMASPAFATSIEVKDAWSRATLTHSMSGVVYMKVANTTGQNDAIVSVETPVAKKAELHRTTMGENGMMDMNEVEKIVLENNTYVQLEPGDLHIMLMGLTQRLYEGNEFPLTLHFEHAPTQTIRVTVQPISYQGE